jgi:hypothetical protein
MPRHEAPLSEGDAADARHLLAERRLPCEPVGIFEPVCGVSIPAAG